MDYDFAVMLSDVIGGKIRSLEIGVGPNGNPIYRVAIYNGKTWKGAIYRSFDAALTTYKFLRRVM
jgi:hypothetical protein